MLRAYKVFLATAYPQSELVGTMKRLLACLALCASLSASAQDDNCTVLGIQDLTQMVLELQTQMMTRDSVAQIAIEVAYVREINNADLSNRELENSDFSYTSLQYANLSNSNFTYSNFRDAVLAHANLSGATLVATTLMGADLSHTDLSGANLLDADLRYSDLSSANLESANSDYANLTGANLTGANLFGATMTCLDGCPSALPSGYICEADPDYSNRYRIVEQ